MITYLSNFTILHQCRVAWVAFATLSEAEDHQSRCYSPDGVTEGADSYAPPGEEWYG